MYPPNMPAPTTTTSNGSPPLLLTSGHVLHAQRPRTSWENAVCWTSTRTCGSGLRRGSIVDSYLAISLVRTIVQQCKLSTDIPTMTVIIGYRMRCSILAARPFRSSRRTCPSEITTTSGGYVPGPCPNCNFLPVVQNATRDNVAAE